MEEEKNFNVFIYIFKMLVCSCVWVLVVSLTIYNLPEFPHKLIEIKFGQDTFSFELSNLIAYSIVFFAQHIMFIKWVYPYTYQTNCKNPMICLLLNIVFGGFIVLSSTEFIEYEGINPEFITNTFVIMAIINYFLFYAKNGYEYREKEYIKDWKNKVYRPDEFPDKNK